MKRFSLIAGSLVAIERMMLPAKITITTKAEAEALLKTYSAEEIRQLWENGAFPSPLPPAVKEFFIELLLNPPEKD